MFLQVDQAAAGLLALGLKKGDRLGVWGPNIYEWILFQFATAKAGIILVSGAQITAGLQLSMTTFDKISQMNLFQHKFF